MKRKIFAIIVMALSACLILAVPGLAIDAENSVLPAELGELNINNKLIEQLADSRKNTGDSKEIATKELIKFQLEDMIIIEHVCKEEGMALSDEEKNAVATYHEKTLGLIQEASQSDNEAECQNAQEVLAMYYRVIEDSGLTQAEYEALAREQMLYHLRRTKLIKEKFDGDELRCNDYILQYKNQHTIVFDNVK